MMFLAIREMKYAKLRYTLIGLIMVLVAWLVLFVTGLANGLASDNAAVIQKMDADYFVLQEGADNRLNRSELSAGQVDAIGGEPFGVRMMTIEHTGKVDVTVFSMNPESEIMPRIVEGKSGVVADQSLQMTIGDQFTDSITREVMTVTGLTEGQSFSHTPAIFVTEGPVSAVAVQSKSIHVDGVELLTKKEALQSIPGYKEEQGSLMMMIVFLFMIAAIVLAVFFYVMTIQKMHQFGVLKAIGTHSIYLARTIISQVIIISIVSLLISVTLVYGIAFVLPVDLPFYLTPSVTAGTSLLFLAVSVLGSLLSLYKVTKVDALDAMGGSF